MNLLQQPNPLTTKESIQILHTYYRHAALITFTASIACVIRHIMRDSFIILTQTSHHWDYSSDFL